MSIIAQSLSALDPILDASIAQREDARQRRLRDEMKEQDARKYRDPQPVDPDLTKVWVVYEWRNAQWILAGFLRRRKRRKTRTMNRFFASVRRKLQISKHAEVKMLDLDAAQRIARGQAVAAAEWTRSGPVHVVSTRPAEPVVQAIKKVKRAKVTHYRKSVATVFHKRETEFVALGRNPWDRDPTYMYLGPLAADTERGAQREAERTFGVYKTLLVLPITALSKRLRQAMHKARKVRPGTTRLLWPEPIVQKDVLALQPAQLRTVSLRDVLLLVADAERRLKGAAKSKKDRSDKIAETLAVLGFLYDLPTYPN